jgi:glycerol-3-phosphate responsive antiterminator
MRKFDGDKSSYFKYDFSAKITYNKSFNEIKFPFYDKIKKIFVIINDIQNNGRYVCVIKDEIPECKYSDIVYDYFDNSIYYDGIIYEKDEFEYYLNRLIKLIAFK